jgi:hypothetical protein
METKAVFFSGVIDLHTGKSRCRLTGIYDSDIVPGGEGVGLLERDLARDVYVEQVHLHAREIRIWLYRCRGRVSPQRAVRASITFASEEAASCQ